MSLRWQVDKVEDYQVVCFNGDGAPKLMTEHLIWATMAVEMGEIRSDNVAEFYARLQIMYRLGYSTHIGPAPEHAPLRASPEDVVAHIGLHTNVPFRSRSQWFGRADGFVKGNINDLMSNSIGEIERLMGAASHV